MAWPGRMGTSSSWLVQNDDVHMRVYSITPAPPPGVAAGYYVTQGNWGGLFPLAP